MNKSDKMNNNVVKWLTDKLYKKYEDKIKGVVESHVYDNAITEFATGYVIERKNNRWEIKCLLCNETQGGRMRYPLFSHYTLHYVTQHIPERKLGLYSEEMDALMKKEQDEKGKK
jgi:hypothetical protein